MVGVFKEKNNNITRSSYKELSYEEKEAIKDIKLLGKNLIELIEDIPDRLDVSNNREFSLAITKVEEAVMWAVKGVSA